MLQTAQVCFGGVVLFLFFVLPVFLVALGSRKPNQAPATPPAMVASPAQRRPVAVLPEAGR